MPAKKKGGSGPKKSGGPKKNILVALAEVRSVGKDAPNRKQLSTLTGYPPNSLNTLLNNLRSIGFVSYDRTSPDVLLTDAGFEEAKKKAGAGYDFDPPQSNEQIHDRLKKIYKLTGKMSEIFHYLVSDGMPHDKQEVMAAMCISNPGSFNTYLGKLRGCGVIVNVDGDSNMLQIAEMCFPLGRPGVSSTNVAPNATVVSPERRRKVNV